MEIDSYVVTYLVSLWQEGNSGASYVAILVRSILNFCEVFSLVTVVFASRNRNEHYPDVNVYLTIFV